MDWDAIKQEYISTNISQRELAEKYGVSVSSLGKRCASEGWSGLRKKFRKKVEKKTMEKISRKKACELAKIGDCADKLIRLINDSLNDTATVRQTIVKIVPSEDDEDEAEVEEYCLQKLDTKYLRQMTAAMKDLMEILRDVYGKPNTVERANMKNARERVEIEKAKAAAGIPTDDEEYGIIEIPAVLEEAAEE
nr:MAG TPA: RK RWP-RK domain [Caudoviricetes sp.]